MWSEFVDWAVRSLLHSQPPLANPEDLAFPQCLSTADEAIALIRERHDRWLRDRNREPGTKND